MALTAKKLFDPALLTASAATYYTAPASTKCVIRKLTFTNLDGSARTVTIYLVPSGGTPSAANTLVSAHSIAAGATYDATDAQKHVLNPGDFIQALASVANVVSIHGSGMELT